MAFLSRASLLRTTPLVLLVLAMACGTEDASTFPEDAGADAVDLDAGTGTGDDATFGGDVTFNDDASSCPSQVLCGKSGTCCGQGQECYDEACVAACATGVHCGSACCGGGQVCLNAACATPGASCNDSFDCAENEFCEPTIGKCLPQPTGQNQCVIQPPTPTFAPVVKWSWTDSATARTGYNQIINMPVIVDLDGNRIPEVIVVTSKDTDAFNQSDKAFLRALNGSDGSEKWPATADVYKDGTGTSADGGVNPDYTVNPRGTPAAGDLDGDGKIEIVAPRRGGGLYAFNADGSFRWRSKKADGVTDYNGVLNSITVAIADMDNDGKAEVVVGGLVFDYTGKLVSDTPSGRESWGANVSSYGAVSIIADVDGNAATKDQHVVTGNRAFKKNGTMIWDKSATLADGYAAIADLDKDGVPELVVTYSVGSVGYVRVQNATTGDVIGTPLQVPGSGHGGPPTIADFDGDTFMEIASANGDKYNVFEFDVGTKALSVKWSHDTQDLSSNVTGSSVFDFEGDGAAEVVYTDECYSRVFKGTDGTVLLEIPNSTGTIHEYPVIADVLGNNHAAYVVVANDRNHLLGGLTCPTTDAGAYVPRHGVFVYGDPNNKWVRTRRIWNEHAYHITNVNSDGTIPAIENRSWEPQGLNNYRVSSQGKGVFNAPDLSVDLEISTQPCPGGLELRARVKNNGSLGVAAGVKVDFYLGTSAQGQFLAEKTTTTALLPGGSEIVPLTFSLAGHGGQLSFFVTVDGGSSASVVPECLEDNNSAGAGGVICPSVR